MKLHAKLGGNVGTPKVGIGSACCVLNMLGISGLNFNVLKCGNENSRTCFAVLKQQCNLSPV